MPNFEGDDNSSDLNGDFPFGPQSATPEPESRLDMFRRAIGTLSGEYPRLRNSAVQATILASLGRDATYEQMVAEAKLMAEEHAGLHAMDGQQDRRYDELFRVAVRSLQGQFPCLQQRAAQAWVRTELAVIAPDLDRVAAMAWMREQIAVAATAYLQQTEAVEATASQELRECHDIMLRAARRCARDLRHANDNIADAELRVLFTERIRLYETVFADLTAYRLELHNTIDNLVEEKERMYKDYVAACETIKQLRAQVEGG